MTKPREQRIKEGTLIPNSFQYPNLYIDWLSFYLTPEEEKVLNKAVREILGWEDKIADRRAQIALSIFVDGKSIRGEAVALGCGLGLGSVRKALAGLNKFGILVKQGDPTNAGQEFRLQDDVNGIDWAGLINRREKWDQANADRTNAATKASMEVRGITSDVGGNVTRYPSPLGVTSHVTPGVASDVPQGVTWDVNKETHETQETKNDVVDILMCFGVDQDVAEELAPKCTLKQVEDWIAYITGPHGRKIKDRVAFLVSRLRKGLYASGGNGKQVKSTDRRRFIEGEYADYIQH